MKEHSRLPENNTHTSTYPCTPDYVPEEAETGGVWRLFCNLHVCRGSFLCVRDIFFGEISQQQS